jgi:RNA 3'-terminal phosphate cyclase-like protein
MLCLPPLLLFFLPCWQPLSITLKGITNDHADPSIDTWRTVTLPLLRRIADLDEAAASGLELRILRRGARPVGGGEVLLRVPMIKQLPLVSLRDEGMVKRVRGIAYSMRVSWWGARPLLPGGPACNCLPPSAWQLRGAACSLLTCRPTSS